MLHLKLHEEARLVNGYLRSVAYDLPRGSFIFLPKELANFLIKNDRKPLALISKNKLFREHSKTLTENEIFFTEDKELIKNFVPLNLEWKSPFIISNVIVDIDKFDKRLIQKQAELFRELNIKHVHYNFSQLPSAKNMDLLLSSLEGSPVQTAVILIQHIDKEFENLAEQCAKAVRVSKILIPVSVKTDFNLSEAVLNKLNYYDPAPQPKKTIWNFTINIRLFAEALRYNVYFNQKLYIDSSGNFKNAPEMSINAGNIKTIQNKKELIKILNSKKFKEYWNISKDKCEVCRHCEFRYMCIDNRIPKKRKEGHYYYETECDYNPFIAKWKGEEGYLPVKECGIILKGLEQPVVVEKYNTILKELWD